MKTGHIITPTIYTYSPRHTRPRRRTVEIEPDDSLYPILDAEKTPEAPKMPESIKNVETVYVQKQTTTIELTGEDSERQYAYWTEDKIREWIPMKMDELITYSIEKIDPYTKFFRGAPNIYQNPKLKKLYDPHVHLSLPEALVLFEASNPEHTIKSATIRLNLLPQKQHSKVLRIAMDSRPQSAFPNYLLGYHTQNLYCLIKEKNKLIGRVTYHIRHNHVEEIDGYIHSKKLLIDPVWKKANTQELSYERLRLGRLRCDLVASQNHQKGLWTSGTDLLKLSVTVGPRIRYPNGVILATKKIKLGTKLTIQSTLLYVKHILIPLGGAITLTKA